MLETLIFKVLISWAVLPTNQKVVGSNPAGLTKGKYHPSWVVFFFGFSPAGIRTHDRREWGNDPSGAPVGHSPKAKTR